MVEVMCEKQITECPCILECESMTDKWICTICGHQWIGMPVNCDVCGANFEKFVAILG